MFLNLVDDLFPKIPVLHLPAVEHDNDADLVAFRNEFIDETQFRFEIVSADLRAEPDFLDVSALLVLFGFLPLFFLFVTVLGKIQNLTNGRLRGWRNLN